MVTKIRQEFEDYLTLRNLSASTHKAYISSVAHLAQYYNRKPDQLTNEEIQQYLLYLIREKKLKWSSVNVQFSAFRCYYSEHLGWEETKFHIPPRPRYKTLPLVMSLEDVHKIINAASNLKHRALLMTIYTAGLRVSEVVHLKPEHIESDRMMIRVEQGKGRKDRYTILAEKTLKTLKSYWLEYRPEKWLFFSSNKRKPMSVCTAQKIYKKAKQAAGVTKGRGIHTLRHCFATDHLEHGTDISTVKKMMGHNSFRTTLIYVHVSNKRISKISSPYDTMFKGGLL